MDTLREWVVSGHASPLDPWTPDTQLQFALAHQSVGAIASRYADAGFTVVIDGVTTESDVAGYGFPFPPHKVLLRPSLDVTLQRNATRRTKAFDTAILEPATRRLFADLATACPAERGWLVVDSTADTVAETVASVLGSTQ